MYAGRFWLGLMFLASVPFLADSPRFLMGLWVVSAIVAYETAKGRQERARQEQARRAADPPLVRRQET